MFHTFEWWPKKTNHGGDFNFLKNNSKFTEIVIHKIATGYETILQFSDNKEKKLWNKTKFDSINIAVAFSC